MRKILLVSFFVGFFLGFAVPALHCEEASQAEKSAEVCQPSSLIIDPLCLPVDITNHFSEKNIDIVKSHKEMIDTLRGMATSWPASEKNEAETLIKQIDNSLNFYVKNLSTPPKAPAESYIRLTKYSLSEVIHLYHLTQQSSNSLTVLKETLAEIENSISDTEILKGQLRKEYVKMDSSPAKGILGLKIIFYWTSVLSYNAQKSLQLTQIQQESDRLKSLEEILDDATDNIIGSPANLREIDSKLQAAEIEWKKTRDNFQQHNLLLLRNKINNTEDEKYKAQALISLEIDEATSHLNYVYLQMKQSMERLLIAPKNVNTEADNTLAYEWQKLLGNYESKVDKWTENTLTQFHRSIEDISIADELEPQSKKETYKKLTKLTQANQVQLLKLHAEIKDLRFLLALFKNNLASINGGSAAWGHQFMTTFYQLADKFRELSSMPLFILSGITITPIDILKFLIIILGSMWLSRVILVALTHFSAHRTGVRKSLVYRIHRLIHYALLTLGFFIALSVIGFDFSSFLLVAGALGVGIGFGLQSIANNFISGIIILFESYLKIGDIIELQSGQKGEILEINFRSTTIRTFDGTDLLIPNSELIDRAVTNWTLADLYRRIHVPFTTAYGVDKDQVAKIIEEGAKEMPMTISRPLKPDPKVNLVKLGDNGLEFELIVWVEVRAVTRTLTAMSDYLWMIDSLLAEHKIEIPYNQMDVRILSK